MAESLFIVEGKSSREIAGLLGMGKETVQRWARDGKWMDRRRLRRSESPLASLNASAARPTGSSASSGGADPSGDPPAAEEPAGEKPAAEQPLAPEAVSDTIGLIHKLTQTIEKMESRREDETWSRTARRTALARCSQRWNASRSSSAATGPTRSAGPHTA